MANRSYETEIYSDGEVIVREGDDSRQMYVIQSGAVLVTRRIHGKRVELAQLERGNFFGEMSLLESVPRNATVRAVGETRLIVIKPGELLLKIRRNPTFALEMLQQMSLRIRRLNVRLADLLRAGDITVETACELETIQIAPSQADSDLMNPGSP
ncbi:MAG: Crp/Fnr family transcriptional regulator [Bythopirellula sp.]